MARHGGTNDPKTLQQGNPDSEVLAEGKLEEVDPKKLLPTGSKSKESKRTPPTSAISASGIPFKKPAQTSVVGKPVSTEVNKTPLKAGQNSEESLADLADPPEEEPQSVADSATAEGSYFSVSQQIDADGGGPQSDEDEEDEQADDFQSFVTRATGRKPIPKKGGVSRAVRTVIQDNFDYVEEDKVDQDSDDKELTKKTHKKFKKVLVRAKDALFNLSQRESKELVALLGADYKSTLQNRKLELDKIEEQGVLKDEAHLQNLITQLENKIFLYKNFIPFKQVIEQTELARKAIAEVSGFIDQVAEEVELQQLKQRMGLVTDKKGLVQITRQLQLKQQYYKTIKALVDLVNQPDEKQSAELRALASNPKKSEKNKISALAAKEKQFKNELQTARDNFEQAYRALMVVLDTCFFQSAEQGKQVKAKFVEAYRAVDRPTLKLLTELAAHFNSSAQQLKDNFSLKSALVDHRDEDTSFDSRWEKEHAILQPLIWILNQALPSTAVVDSKAVTDEKEIDSEKRLIAKRLVIGILQLKSFVIDLNKRYYQAPVFDLVSSSRTALLHIQSLLLAEPDPSFEKLHQLKAFCKKFPEIESLINQFALQVAPLSQIHHDWLEEKYYGNLHLLLPELENASSRATPQINPKAQALIKIILPLPPTPELAKLLPLIRTLLIKPGIDAFNDFHKHVQDVITSTPALEKPLCEFLFEVQYASQAAPLKEVSAEFENLKLQLQQIKLTKEKATVHPFDETIVAASNALKKAAPDKFAKHDGFAWMLALELVDEKSTDNVYRDELKNKIRDLARTATDPKVKALAAFFELPDAFVSISKMLAILAKGIVDKTDLQDAKTAIQANCTFIFAALETALRLLDESASLNKKPKDILLSNIIQFIRNFRKNFATSMVAFSKNFGIEGPKALLESLTKPEKLKSAKLVLSSSDESKDSKLTATSHPKAPSGLASSSSSDNHSKLREHKWPDKDSSHQPKPVGIAASSSDQVPVAAGQSMAQQLSLGFGQTSNPKLSDAKDAKVENQPPLKSTITFERGQEFTPTEADFISMENIKQLQEQLVDLYRGLVEQKHDGVNEAHFDAAIAKVKQELDSKIEQAVKASESKDAKDGSEKVKLVQDSEAAKVPKKAEPKDAKDAKDEIDRLSKLAIPAVSGTLATFIRLKGNKPFQLYEPEQRAANLFEAPDRREFVEDSKLHAEPSAPTKEVPCEPYAEQLETRIRKSAEKDPALGVLKAYWSLRDGFLQIPQLISLLKTISASLQKVRSLEDVLAIKHQHFELFNSILADLLKGMTLPLQKLDAKPIITESALTSDVNTVKRIHRSFANLFQQLTVKLTTFIEKEFFLLATKDKIQNIKFGIPLRDAILDFISDFNFMADFGEEDPALNELMQLIKVHGDLVFLLQSQLQAENFDLSIVGDALVELSRKHYLLFKEVTDLVRSRPELKNHQTLIAQQLLVIRRDLTELSDNILRFSPQVLEQLLIADWSQDSLQDHTQNLQRLKGSLKEPVKSNEASLGLISTTLYSPLVSAAASFIQALEINSKDKKEVQNAVSELKVHIQRLKSLVAQFQDCRAQLDNLERCTLAEISKICTLLFTLSEIEKVLLNDVNKLVKHNLQAQEQRVAVLQQLLELRRVFTLPAEKISSFLQARNSGNNSQFARLIVQLNKAGWSDKNLKAWEGFVQDNLNALQSASASQYTKWGFPLVQAAGNFFRALTVDPEHEKEKELGRYLDEHNSLTVLFNGYYVQLGMDKPGYQAQLGEKLQSLTIDEISKICQFLFDFSKIQKIVLAEVNLLVKYNPQAMNHRVEVLQQLLELRRVFTPIAEQMSSYLQAINRSKDFIFEPEILQLGQAGWTARNLKNWERFVQGQANALLPSVVVTDRSQQQATAIASSSSSTVTKVDVVVPSQAIMQTQPATGVQPKFEVKRANSSSNDFGLITQAMPDTKTEKVKKTKTVLQKALHRSAKDAWKRIEESHFSRLELCIARLIPPERVRIAGLVTGVLSKPTIISGVPFYTAEYQGYLSRLKLMTQQLKTPEQLVKTLDSLERTERSLFASILPNIQKDLLKAPIYKSFLQTVLQLKADLALVVAIDSSGARVLQHNFWNPISAQDHLVQVCGSMLSQQPKSDEKSDLVASESSGQKDYHRQKFLLDLMQHAKASKELADLRKKQVKPLADQIKEIDEKAVAVRSAYQQRAALTNKWIFGNWFRNLYIRFRAYRGNKEAKTEMWEIAASNQAIVKAEAALKPLMGPDYTEFSEQAVNQRTIVVSLGYPAFARKQQTLLDEQSRKQEQQVVALESSLFKESKESDAQNQMTDQLLLQHFEQADSDLLLKRFVQNPTMMDSSNMQQLAKLLHKLNPKQRIRIYMTLVDKNPTSPVLKAWSKDTDFLHSSLFYGASSLDLAAAILWERDKSQGGNCPLAKYIFDNSHLCATLIQSETSNDETLNSVFSPPPPGEGYKGLLQTSSTLCDVLVKAKVSSAKENFIFTDTKCVIPVRILMCIAYAIHLAVNKADILTNVVFRRIYDRFSEKDPSVANQESPPLPTRGLIDLSKSVSSTQTSQPLRKELESASSNPALPQHHQVH